MIGNCSPWPPGRWELCLGGVAGDGGRGGLVDVEDQRDFTAWRRSTGTRGNDKLLFIWTTHIHVVCEACFKQLLSALLNYDARWCMTFRQHMCSVDLPSRSKVTKWHETPKLRRSSGRRMTSNFCWLFKFSWNWSWETTLELMLSCSFPSAAFMYWMIWSLFIFNAQSTINFGAFSFTTFDSHALFVSWQVLKVLLYEAEGAALQSWQHQGMYCPSSFKR